MSTFEICVLVGLGVNATILWEIRDAARKTHDLLIDAKIERIKKKRGIDY